MNEKPPKLYINLFGDVSLTYNGNTINDQNIRSKKFWTLLEYLIVYRKRKIPQSELIDLIYPEDKSENPANALKTLIHRIRGGLDQLEYMDSHDMILQAQGTYAWNTEMDYVIDVEEFEKLYYKGNLPSTPDDEKLNCYLKAIDIYNGDFLQKSAFEPWAAQFNTFYHTLYINIVHKTIEMLKQQNEHEKIVELCERALNINNFDESLYYNLILGLVKANNSQAALTAYRKMADLFYREFGVTPSKETMRLYRDIIRTSKEVETDLSVIKEDLREDGPSKGPFFCEYEIFKDVYRIEARAAARIGESVHICLMTLTMPDGGIPDVKTLNNYMDKLYDCISKNLRRGDVFARYSVSQFILLLPLTTYENGEMVMKRVIKLFNKHHPYYPLSIHYAIQALEVVPI